MALSKQEIWDRYANRDDGFQINLEDRAVGRDLQTANLEWKAGSPLAHLSAYFGSQGKGMDADFLASALASKGLIPGLGAINLDGSSTNSNNRDIKNRAKQGLAELAGSGRIEDMALEYLNSVGVDASSASSGLKYKKNPMPMPFEQPTASTPPTSSKLF